ncbi:CNNM domain-containing protein [Marinomonas sp. FW-1]|uniref:CNNM domain-containing protein n=1 Tax=Marinomonas sp. FW-1 TaxID=2071621 RepID=UPI0010BFB3BA|nr:hemolysin family protein [Marinomonas sp. FW-1]
MSTDALLLIIYVLTAIGFSFLCSVAEAVLLSITPSYVEGMKEKQPKFALRLKRLKQDNIDQSLAAILTLNTIAHTAGAIGAGAKATAVFGSAWFGVFSAAMTMAILFFSEIVPKTIGAIYWSKLVVPTMYFVQGLILILYPIVWVSEKLTKLISHGKTLHHFSRDEFIAMAELGKADGQIHDSESRVIRNLFRYGSVKAMDVMTPRTVAFALSENQTVSEVFELIKSKPFSRLPVYKSGFDDITGFVLRDDILLSKASDRHNETLKSLKRDITVVPEKVSLPMLLDSFLNERQHIALVVDEYGRVKGIVTLEDLVETLLGVEIMDEMDSVENMRVLARKMWTTRARALGIEVDRVE